MKDNLENGLELLRVQDTIKPWKGSSIFEESGVQVLTFEEGKNQPLHAMMGMRKLLTWLNRVTRYRIWQRERALGYFSSLLAPWLRICVSTADSIRETMMITAAKNRRWGKKERAMRGLQRWLIIWQGNAVANLIKRWRKSETVEPFDDLEDHRMILRTGWIAFTAMSVWLSSCPEIFTPFPVAVSNLIYRHGCKSDTVIRNVKGLKNRNLPNLVIPSISGDTQVSTPIARRGMRADPSGLNTTGENTFILGYCGMCMVSSFPS